MRQTRDAAPSNGALSLGPNGTADVAQPRGGRPPSVWSPRAGSADRGKPTTSPRRIDVIDLFFHLARIKAALCAAVDDSLRAEHGISLQAFDGMTLISERGEGCDEPTLASSLGLSPERARELTVSLSSGGYATRTRQADSGEPLLVRLTLPGTLLLRRAGVTVDRELSRRLGCVLAEPEIAALTDALATARQPSERAEPRVSPERTSPRRVRADSW